jgi:hypothetical protein
MNLPPHLFSRSLTAKGIVNARDTVSAHAQCFVANMLRSGGLREPQRQFAAYSQIAALHGLFFIPGENANKKETSVSYHE